METIVDLQNVKKTYKLYKNGKERFMDLFLPIDVGESFHALKGVSFQARKGDSIGIIGTNGSGKSTLLNIIAGVVPETSGEVNVEGETALVAVASGLKGNLTGRENIELKCLMLGFSKKEVRDMETDIIEFSELGSFIDQPVKSYSSGMKSRLGFAISMKVDPDILIIDEALSVGDKRFANKCHKTMEQFKGRGKTIFFVSHSIPQVKQFCEKALWLHKGEIKQYGDAEDVTEAYDLFISS
ncbi:ABC transporter ATP-binding protein (plasmid) [Pontibacillus sp. ALD_SL1]|uniref:ABC transporter ATP-binding protein n=1 Tax=Pontibacillus sp. ALD_SL1 TaxID=2777185 RepID=UPI001A96D52D|nr:ABC transporter ATP-binding protein [Pontibacillus sp. ALD_SL1]QST02830.1 ABC transporter ATP-binding protein [Pontibacillus sp. ALD_SL1]